MARTSTTDLTAAEVNIVQGLEPLGSALQVVRVNAGGTALEYATIGGTGDMILSSVQTNSGLKTFLSGTFALRNVANTASGFFTNTNTADRTYTLQDRNGTLADDTDLALKANLASPTFTGTVVFPSGQALIAPVLDTPTSGNLSNCTDAIAYGLKSATTTVSVSAATAPTNGQVLTATSGTTATWQTPSGGSFSWGASVSAGSGVGLTMTSADLSGANAFQSSTHTASGTLTACTTTQNTYSTSRTYTLTSGSVTDNFIGTLFSRTNVTTGAGGTLLAQGPVVNITGTDTQTAGTLTPSYDLLKLQPSLRSTGSSINVTVANSVATAPTNGHIYAVLGDTNTVAQIVQKIDTGTSATAHTGLRIRIANASTTAVGIIIDPSTTGTGTGIRFADNGGAGFTGIYWNNAISGGSGTRYAIRMDTINNGAGTSYGWYVGNLGGDTQGNTGKYFSLNNAQSSTSLQARTNDASEILFSRTGTATSGTVADNFNLSYFRRTSVQNGAGGTLTATGSVLKLENVATQTAGTLTDTVACLSLVQDNDSTGGHILFNTYTGVPLVDGTLYFDGTNFKYRAGGVTKTITAT